MKRWRTGFVSMLALLSACGGDGASNGGGPIAAVPTPTPAPPPVNATCSLRARQDFAFQTLNEFYLFPETLPASLDPTPYATVSDYIDALTATARSQGRDRFFTYVTSISQENAFFNSGTTAGFGVRLAFDSASQRLVIIESYENGPALNAGIDRGDEIVAIGTSSATLRNVSDIFAASGSAGVSDALGPNTPGTARTLTVRNTASGASRTVSVTKADFALTPVSSRYGSKIITDNGEKIGYLNLRTFISTADPQLRAAFAQFRAQNITKVVVDLRYNGGGLVSTGELLGDLLGGNRRSSDVFSRTTFRPSKSSNNETKFFAPQSESISPMKIAFIGTGATASASELVINAFTPYLGSNVALIGANTFGKPVGQIAVDRAACDDRIRVIAFSLRNAANSDNYYNGLAGTVGATCRAGDDITRQLGDPQEASTRAALDFLAGRSCVGGSIASEGRTASADRSPVGVAAKMTPLSPSRPTTPQRDAPGTF